MDGRQARLNGSIRLRLALWQSLAIVGFALCASVLSYVGALKEANGLQDDTLRQVAALVGEQADLARSLASRAQDADPESNLIVQPLSCAAGHGLRPALALPPRLVDGAQTVEVTGVSYRVLVRMLPDGSRIAVSQQTEVRDEIARHSALRVLLPLLLLAPVLMLLVAQLVRGMLGPIARLSREVDARSQHELHALPERGVPSEIQPFITAINRLLARMQQAMAVQRRFVADAAHELRSPLTALSLQAERLQGAEMSGQARERLQVLCQGIERGRHLLDQLLGLARSYDGADEAAPPLSLQKVCRLVLEDLLPLAEAKGIDLGVVLGDDVCVAAPEADLAAILRNLVDNAIRYTPTGGHVDVRVARRAEHAVVQVEDNGPGIPADERARVLDPFYRILGTQQLGSGLGLSIVQAVVQHLGGRIEIDDSPTFGRGLRVAVTLPPAARLTAPRQG
jgi:two-component system OmpR family sensor kinase